MKLSKEKLLKLVYVLAVIGFFLSLYLVKNHYEGVSAGSFCDFNESISCSLVNSSVFSELFNVPVAILGALWFFILGLITYAAKKKDSYVLGFLVWSILGFLFIIYMIIAEIILRSICPLCTIIHVINLIVLIIGIYLYKNTKKLKKKEIIKKYRLWVVGVVILFALPFIILNIGGESKDYSEFTKCLDESGLKMYGSFRCGVCAKTRDLFGDAFENIEEIECHPQGENSQTELCFEKGIERTPTWVLEKDGREIVRHVGFASPEKLAEMSGCGLDLIKDG